MTSKELDKMVNAMRRSYDCNRKFNTRAELTDTLFRLYSGLCALQRFELADKILNLWSEIEVIDTSEIVKIGTFRQ